jgi:subtilisin family serine protease
VNRLLLPLLIATCLVQPSSAAARPDPLQAQQWGLAQVHAAQAWGTSTGRGVVVAVIDSLVDGRHPDLRGAVLPGVDLTGAGRYGNGVDPYSYHATAISGIIAARRNGVGIAGVAPEATILPIRIGRGAAIDSNLLPKAIRYAVDHHARVISLSIGLVAPVGPPQTAVGLDDEAIAAIAYAWEHDVLVVAAAGNNAVPYCDSPASLPHVLCVGALDKRQLRSYYSQGSSVADGDYLMAPGGGSNVEGIGEDFLSTTTPGTSEGVSGSPATGSWTEVVGTSYAAPHVVAVAALLRARGLSAARTLACLETTAQDLGVPGNDPVYGYGEVDAAAAVRCR